MMCPQYLPFKKVTFIVATPESVPHARFMYQQDRDDQEIQFIQHNHHYRYYSFTKMMEYDHSVPFLELGMKLYRIDINRLVVTKK